MLASKSTQNIFTIYEENFEEDRLSDVDFEIEIQR
jgi:hypothetical protein